MVEPIGLHVACVPPSIATVVRMVVLVLVVPIGGTVGGWFSRQLFVRFDYIRDLDFGVGFRMVVLKLCELVSFGSAVSVRIV